MLLTRKKMSVLLNSFLFAMILAIALPSHVFAAVNEPEPEEEPKEFAFEDDVLLRFFDANQAISAAQREMNEQITEAVEAQGLTMERFNQIRNAAQIGALQGGAFTDDEINSFNQLGPQITQIQRDMQQAVANVLQDHDFTNNSYQEVLNDYRQDQELQAHVRELLRERRRQEILEERRREAEEKAMEEQEQGN